MTADRDRPPIFCDFPTCSTVATLRLSRTDDLTIHTCLDHYEENVASLRQWPGEPVLSLPRSKWRPTDG